MVTPKLYPQILTTVTMSTHPPCSTAGPEIQPKSAKSDARMSTPSTARISWMDGKTLGVPGSCASRVTTGVVSVVDFQLCEGDVGR